MAKVEEKQLSSAYFHINNGGISLKILNEISDVEVLGTTYHTEVPVLEISADHFGTQTNNIKIPMGSFDMEKIGNWLIENSKKCKEFEQLKDCYYPTVENGIQFKRIKER